MEVRSQRVNGGLGEGGGVRGQEKMSRETV